MVGYNLTIVLNINIHRQFINKSGKVNNHYLVSFI